MPFSAKPYSILAPSPRVDLAYRARSDRDALGSSGAGRELHIRRIGAARRAYDFVLQAYPPAGLPGVDHASDLDLIWTRGQNVPRLNRATIVMMTPGTLSYFYTVTGRHRPGSNHPWNRDNRLAATGARRRRRLERNDRTQPPVLRLLNRVPDPRPTRWVG